MVQNAKTNPGNQTVRKSSSIIPSITLRRSRFLAHRIHRKCDQETRLRCGEFKKILVEQYKEYVKSADNLSSRRGQDNKYYITVLSSFVAGTFYLYSHQEFSHNKGELVTILGLLGLLLSLSWKQRLISYRQLSSAKYKVLHDMEQHLGFPCFKDEWKHILSAEKKYKNLTSSEEKLPFASTMIFFITSSLGLIEIINQNKEHISFVISKILTAYAHYK
ncbi:MAG: hypothetical protein FD177_2429 [Desulfovibrionaceae bacterium]|nr:MAG: hypothetical protein FD177_2429 [Desulfovibrionaceae bacterium]